jgi:hypothetical protein
MLAAKDSNNKTITDMLSARIIGRDKENVSSPHHIQNYKGYMHMLSACYIGRDEQSVSSRH